MTWTYDNDPTGVPRDEVRLLVGDTDATDQLITDEEIAYSLAKNPNPYRAAADMARVIAAKFARLVTASVGSVSESASDLWTHYKDLAKELDRKAGTYALPSFGGLTIAEHVTDNADTGLVQANAKKDQYDNPRAVRNSDSPEDV